MLLFRRISRLTLWCGLCLRHGEEMVELIGERESSRDVLVNVVRLDSERIANVRLSKVWCLSAVFVYASAFGPPWKTIEAYSG